MAKAKRITDVRKLRAAPAKKVTMPKVLGRKMGKIIDKVTMPQPKPKARPKRRRK